MKQSILLPLALLPILTLSSPGQDKVDFKKDVAPVFRESCVGCHGPEKQKARLRLDSKADTFKGGRNGPVLKPGNAAESEFYRRIILPKGHDELMPAEADPLPKAVTDLIKAWIDQGAEWPDDVAIEVAASTPPPATTGSDPASLIPDPVLPKDFKPAPAEAQAIAAIAKAGVDVRPIAQNSPWTEANFRLQGASITDEAIAPLQNLASLVELNLANTKVTDAGLAAIARLPHLMTLHLELTGISDAGLAHVKSLSNLVYLNLYGTQVTDAGLDHLQQLPHLKRLYVWQSKVTPEGATKLRQAKPGLDINTGWDLSSLTNAPANPDQKKDEKK